VAMLYLVFALLFSLLIAVVAMANGEIVTVNYLFGQADLSLIVLILGSASAGALTLGSFSLFRGIQTHLQFREARQKQAELQQRVEFLEGERSRLEAEVGRRQMENEAVAAKEHAEETLQSVDEPNPTLSSQLRPAEGHEQNDSTHKKHSEGNKPG